MTYRMKEVMKQTGLSEKTIRFYISKALISPKKESGLHRTNYYFTDTQINELNNINLLRKFGFSIQDIIEIQSNDSSRIHSVLLRNKNERNQYLEQIKLWNTAPIDTDTLYTRDSLLAKLRINYDIALKEKLFSGSFSDFDTEAEDIISSSPHKKPVINYPIFILAVLLIFVAGYFCGTLKKTSVPNSLTYGISEQALAISDVVWKDFPGFRKVSFLVNGEITINLPDNATITLPDSESSQALVETKRTDMVHSDGTDIIKYDIVTYTFSDVPITSDGILKNKDYFNGAMDGYEIKLQSGSMEFSLGYIMPLANELITFSETEYSSFNYNLSYHDEIYRLSDTYNDGLPLTTIPVADGIILEKTDDELFHYRIINNSSFAWKYCADIADIEMYYRGVWLKVTSPYDSNLSVLESPPGSIIEYLYNNKNINSYPYLIPGIYRLVVYGVDNTYIASEDFIIN